MILPDTAKALAYYDHPFFGKYPAITKNFYGKGSLTYEGTVLSEKLQKAVLFGVLKDAGIISSDQDLPAAVHVKHAKNRQGKTLHFYLNYSSLSQAANYSYAPGINLLTQDAVLHGQSLTLQPWDLAIVEEQ